MSGHLARAFLLGALTWSAAATAADPLPTLVFQEDFARARTDYGTGIPFGPGKLRGSIFTVGEGTVDIGGIGPRGQSYFGPCGLPPAKKCLDMIGNQPAGTPTEIHTAPRRAGAGYYVIQFDTLSLNGETLDVTFAGHSVAVPTSGTARTVTLPFTLAQPVRSPLSIRLSGGVNTINGPLLTSLYLCQVSDPSVTRCR